jgi:competence protein ComEC
VTRIHRLLPAREASVACAVLLGIREQESRLASRPFADLGLAHLFAVSGLHVGVLLGFVLWPLRMSGCGPWERVGPILALLPTYVLLTGMPGSVVRAAGLGFLALLAGAMGKPAQPLRLIGLLFWAGTIWDPGQNLDTGLKLSYLAAGGILAVSHLTDGFAFKGAGVFRPLYTGLAVSCAAQWFTLPVVAASFGRISLLSPLANLVAVPLFSLGVWCLVLAVVLGEAWYAGAQYMAAVAWFLFRFLGGLAGDLSKASSGFPLGLPSPNLAGVFTWVMLTGMGLLILRRHRRGRLPGLLGLVMIALVIGSGLVVLGPAAWTLKTPARVTVWQFDVGQGDCGLLIFPDGWSMLIDTGGTYGFTGKSGEGPLSRTVLPFLQRNGMTRLAAVVLTHGHRDHTGGASALAAGLEVDRWYVSGRADLSLKAIADSTSIIRPAAGRVLHRWAARWWWFLAEICRRWRSGAEISNMRERRVCWDRDGLRRGCRSGKRGIMAATPRGRVRGWTDWILTSSSSVAGWATDTDIPITVPTWPAATAWPSPARIFRAVSSWIGTGKANLGGGPW